VVAEYEARTAALERDNLVGSMSGVANPYDNAQAESFMKTLKVGEVDLAGYETFKDVAVRLPRSIEDGLQRPAACTRLSFTRRVRNATCPAGGLVRLTPVVQPQGFTPVER